MCLCVFWKVCAVLVTSEHAKQHTLTQSPGGREYFWKQMPRISFECSNSFVNILFKFAKKFKLSRKSSNSYEWLRIIYGFISRFFEFFSNFQNFQEICEFFANVLKSIPKIFCEFSILWSEISPPGRTAVLFMKRANKKKIAPYCTVDFHVSKLIA